MARRAVTDRAGQQFWEHRQEVRAIARRVLQDASMAEDVAQEALLRALSNETTIDDSGRGAWLTVVGRRLAIDETRSRQRMESRAELDDQAVMDQDPALIAEHRALLGQVLQAVGRLSPRQQRLLLGQVAAGLSLEQMAAEESTTVASVRSVLARARESVRASLQDTGWLVAANANRLVNAAQDATGSLLARLEQVAPRIPNMPRETGEAVGAAMAAVGLLFGSSSAPAPAPAADQAPSSPAVAAAAAATPSSADAASSGPLDEAAGLLSAREQLSTGVSHLPTVPDDEGQQVIPFTDTDGEIVQFAVSPDQQTVLASGGYGETPESRGSNALVREWEPTLYRSEDGGRHWKRVRAPGFVPGRVLFAPEWPADARVFVVTDRGVIQSTDGGRTFRNLEPPPTGPPTTHNPTQPINPYREAAANPGTTIRSEQRPPYVALRPAVLSPRFAAGDERIYLGGPAEVVDVQLGVTEPLVSVPPWARSRGVAAAPDYALSEAVLVGATVHVGTAERAALMRCAQRQCTQLHVFEDISEPPGVFTSPDDPGLVYVWTTYATYRSTDGGWTWERQRLGPVVDLVEVGGRLVFLSLSDIPVSDDWGATWRNLRVLYSITAVAPISDNGLLLAAGVGMACSPDRGDHWLPACA